MYVNLWPQHRLNYITHNNLIINKKNSEHFQRSLAAAVEKTMQKEAQSIKDINHLALKVLQSADTLSSMYVLRY